MRSDDLCRVAFMTLFWVLVVMENIVGLATNPSPHVPDIWATLNYV
jgi:hypothetical protein